MSTTHGNQGYRSVDGLTLLEASIALFILLASMLTAFAWIDMSTMAEALGRGKAHAAVAAENRLQTLSILFRSNPDAPGLRTGRHGPEFADLRDQNSGTVIHRVRLTWDVIALQDPRPGRSLRGKKVLMEAVPVSDTGDEKERQMLYRRTFMEMILSPEL